MSIKVFTDWIFLIISGFCSKFFDHFFLTGTAGSIFGRGQLLHHEHNHWRAGTKKQRDGGNRREVINSINACQKRVLPSDGMSYRSYVSGGMRTLFENKRDDDQESSLKVFLQQRSKTFKCGGNVWSPKERGIYPKCFIEHQQCRTVASYSTSE